MSIGLADIFASVRLNLDTGKFETDALKSATVVSGKMGGVLKKAVGGAIGAGAGLAFASMSRGALELDAAMSKLQASTGMTADEAKVAGKAMAALFKDNLQEFDEIGDAMAAVHNDLGLVGEAANKATEEFLKYATATGQVATDAVVAFDDVLDAWGLTAEDAAGIMDQLVASHQEYGGSIADNQQALAAMAPQLRALNVNTTDAIGLLNLFAASGMDSAKATFALNTAVKTLKPGQSLDDLIAQIAAIEDPTVRAQEAIKVFGARGGVAMANILQPGIKGLADFAIKAEDVTTATEDAARAIEDSMGNRVKLALKELNGTLAEVGTNMGDLLMVSALLGPGLTRNIAAALGGLGGIIAAQILGTQAAATVAGATVGTATGTAMGTMMAAAAALAVPAAIAGAIALVGVGIALAIDKAAPGLAERMNRNFFAGVEAVGRWFSGGKIAGAAAKEGFRYGWQTGLPGPDVTFGPTTNALVPEAKGAFVPVGEAAVKGFTGGIISGFEDTRAAGKALNGAVADGYRTAGPAIVAAAKRTVWEVRQAIVEGKGGIISAWRDALTERNTAANAADQIIINNAEIAAAIKIRDNKKLTDAERAEARIRIRNLKASNSELLVTQTQYGTRAEQIAKTKGLLTSEALLAGLKDKDPEVRQHWIDVKATLQKQLGNLDDKGEALGTGFAVGFLKGLRSRNVAVASQAANLIRLLGLRPSGMATGGPVTAGVPYIVGEHHAEVFVPEVDGRILPSVPASHATPSVTSTASGGGMTFVYAPMYSSASPGEAQRFAQDVGPSITRWQQGRGLLGAR